MELKQINEALNKFIRPQTFPVAIRMAESADELPSKAKSPRRDLGKTMPVCQGIALARRYGWVISMDREDMLCPLGSFTLGFLPPKDKFLEGDFNVPFWVKDKEIRSKISKALPRLEYGKYCHALIAPLHRADFEPHSIIVYGNPAQISRLVQGSIYEAGEPVSMVSWGGFACSFEITMPMITGKCQVIMAGGGDRALAQAHDSEAAFAFPANKAEPLIQGIEETHKAGLRYPTPTFLTFQGQFPPGFGELMEYLTGSDRD